MLRGRVQLIEVPAESVLGLEGDLESCVYFIATGKLKVYRHTGDAGFNSQVRQGISSITITIEELKDEVGMVIHKSKATCICNISLTFVACMMH